MKNDFAMLNFCTEYSSDGDVKHRMNKEACFGEIFRNRRMMKNKYTIKIYKIGDVLNKEKRNNACFMDKVGVIHHLKILKSVLPFKYKIKEMENCYILTLIVEGKNIYHRYILSWVRYLYEFPFNVFLMDAHRMKSLPEFKFESIINLFNVVGATTKIGIFGEDIHGIGDTRKFKALMTIKEIKNSLKNLEYNPVLNNTFPNIEEEIRKISHTCVKDHKTLHSSDYWESNEEFDLRLENYKFNYKILKNYKKNK